MFVREKRINDYTYLYLVETVREEGRAKQRIIKNLGRKEALAASGALERLASSVARYAERAVVLSQLEAVNLDAFKASLQRPEPPELGPALRRPFGGILRATGIAHMPVRRSMKPIRVRRGPTRTSIVKRAISPMRLTGTGARVAPSHAKSLRRSGSPLR